MQPFRPARLPCRSPYGAHTPTALKTPTNIFMKAYITTFSTLKTWEAQGKGVCRKRAPDARFLMHVKEGKQGRESMEREGESWVES